MGLKAVRKAMSSINITIQEIRPCSNRVYDTLFFGISLSRVVVDALQGTTLLG